MPLFSVVVSFNNKKRAFAQTLFYYPWYLSWLIEPVGGPREDRLRMNNRLGLRLALSSWRLGGPNSHVTTFQHSRQHLLTSAGSVNLASLLTQQQRHFRYIILKTFWYDVLYWMRPEHCAYSEPPYLGACQAKKTIAYTQLYFRGTYLLSK